jgi:diaminopimelate epimerase
MTLKFTKMHGSGNDFMMVDSIQQKINLSPEKISQWSKRDTGVGFDQCLLIEKSDKEGIDFFYRIFNANGNEVGQCGNGARCLARYVQHYQLSEKLELSIATNTTRMKVYLNDDQSVTVDMGLPQFDPENIPLNIKQQATIYTIPLAAQELHYVHAVSIGNPHAVVVIPDTTLADVPRIGQQISEHPLFPEQTNVGFMQLIDPHHIRLRVYERGSGETKACGSGAVAAMAIGRRYHQLASDVTVSLPGGDLLVSWSALNESIFLTGPATFVYEGQLFI